MNNVTIKRVESTNFLGVIIDQHLTWNEHILAISNKVSMNIGVIGKLRHFLPGYVLILLYNTMVLPYLIYCNAVWANIYPTRLKRLVQLQKKILRICTNSEYNASSKPLFKKVNLLPFHQLNKLCIALLVFKHKQNHLPPNLASIIKCKSLMHNYNTRNPENYYIDECKNTATSFSFKYKGPFIWNSLPRNLKQDSSLNSFKSKLKEHLLTNFK